MALKALSRAGLGDVGLDLSNTGEVFFILKRCDMKLSGDTPLFWFEIGVLYSFNRFWLVEWCVFWSGDRQVMEMVEVKGDPREYVGQE